MSKHLDLTEILLKINKLFSNGDISLEDAKYIQDRAQRLHADNYKETVK